MFLGNIMFYAIGSSNGYLRELFFFIMIVDLSMFVSPMFVVEDEIKNRFKDIEIKDYFDAYMSLVFSADSKTVYNPTLKDVWFEQPNGLFLVKSGETVCLG